MGLYFLDRKLATTALPYLQAAQINDPLNAQYVANMAVAYMMFMIGPDDVSAKFTKGLEQLLVESEKFGSSMVMKWHHSNVS